MRNPGLGDFLLRRIESKVLGEAFGDSNLTGFSRGDCSDDVSLRFGDSRSDFLEDRLEEERSSAVSGKIREDKSHSFGIV